MPGAAVTLEDPLSPNSRANMPDDVSSNARQRGDTASRERADSREGKPDRKPKPFVFGSTKKMLDSVQLDGQMVPAAVVEDDPLSPTSPDSVVSPTSAGSRAKRRIKWSSKNRAETGLLSDDDWLQMTMDDKNRNLGRILALFRSILMSTHSPTGYWIHSNQASFIFCSLIVINAIYMGLEMELAPTPPTTPWQVADYSFLVFFTIELLLRIIAEKRSFVDSSW